MRNRATHRADYGSRIRGREFAVGGGEHAKSRESSTDSLEFNSRRGSSTAVVVIDELLALQEKGARD